MRTRGVLGLRTRGAGLRVQLDEAGVVVDLVRPWRLARAAGFGGIGGLRALRTIVDALRRASVPIRVRSGGVTVLRAGRGLGRVSPWGLALAAVAGPRTRGRT